MQCECANARCRAHFHHSHCDLEASLVKHLGHVEVNICQACWDAMKDSERDLYEPAAVEPTAPEPAMAAPAVQSEPPQQAAPAGVAGERRRP